MLAKIVKAPVFKDHVGSEYSGGPNGRACCYQLVSRGISYADAIFEGGKLTSFVCARSIENLGAPFLARCKAIEETKPIN